MKLYKKMYFKKTFCFFLLEKKNQNSRWSSFIRKSLNLKQQRLNLFLSNFNNRKIIFSESSHETDSENYILVFSKASKINFSLYVIRSCCP